MTNRRDFLKKAALSTAGLALLQLPFVKAADNQPQIILRGGRAFIDNKWQTPDIGILTNGRLLISPKIDAPQAEVIDCTGKVVSQGFVDILADNSFRPEETFAIYEKYKLGDGVTTALQMHGGHHSATEFYRSFGKQEHYVNYGVSTKIMNIRRFHTKELPKLLKVIEDNLQAGALGVSHSVEYQPVPYQELEEYAKLAVKYDKVLFLHLRHSSEDKELDGVREAIELARQTGVRVHIDHLHSTGGTYHMNEALDLICQARNKGLQVTTCVYPYTYWATYIPSSRFDAGWQQRYNITYEDLEVVGTGERLTKATFDKYRKSEFWRLVAVPEGTMPAEKSIIPALAEDFCMIGSDGGIEKDNKPNNHPRGAGCFATALYLGQKYNLPLEVMLQKMTTLPRSLVASAMPDRGLLKNDFYADLTVFDPKEVNGAATVAKPNQFSKGIDKVFVNGKLAFENQKAIAKNGQAVVGK